MVKRARKLKPWSPDGKRWYLRIGGRYVRVKGEPGTEAFDRSYWDVLNGRAPAPRTSWRALCDAFHKSDRWKALKPRTQSDYDLVIDYILSKNADKDAAKVTRREVLAAMEANRHRIRFANYIKSVMGILFEFAIDLDWRTDNPARGVRSLKVPADRRKDHLPWTDDAVAAFRAGAFPLARLIFEIGLGSVQRPGDWVRFTWGDYDGACLRLRQGKTGKPLVLPCTAALKGALDAVQPASPIPGQTIIAQHNGQPLTYRGMAQIMLLERARLGLEAFDLHALRYRGVMELAWAGCSDEEIASYSGHGSLAMIRLYAGEARQIMRARSAREKRG